MAKHFQNELERLKKKILTLGSIVEGRVQKACKAIITKDVFDADCIIKEDYEIDEMEVEIEEECLKILALYQPVAVDLRFLIAVIKINNDLERIADEAVNIAFRVKRISKHPEIDYKFDYSVMSEKAIRMFRSSLDALVTLDVDLAMKVCLMDDEVDKLHSDSYDKIKKMIQVNPEHVGYLINLLLISRHLERIGDHATNIAEEVVYMVEGDIVRHGNY